jgi:hypothetical protein
LNLIFMLDALLLFQVGFSQLCFTISKKPGWAAQKDSNQNNLVVGGLDGNDTWHMVCTGFPWGKTQVVG